MHSEAHHKSHLESKIISTLQIVIRQLQAIKVLNMIKLFGKAIRVNKASQDKDTLDVGANLFIGNLDPDVDEKVWHRICSRTCCAYFALCHAPRHYSLQAHLKKQWHSSSRLTPRHIVAGNLQ